MGAVTIKGATVAVFFFFLTWATVNQVFRVFKSEIIKVDSCSIRISVLICWMLFFFWHILKVKISSVWAFILYSAWKTSDKDKTFFCDGDASLSGQMHRHLSPLSLLLTPLCFPSALPHRRSPRVLKQADRMLVIYNVLSLSIAAKWYEVNQGRSNERLRIHSCEHILSVVSVTVAAPEEARMRRAEGP